MSGVTALWSAEFKTIPTPCHLKIFVSALRLKRSDLEMDKNSIYQNLSSDLSWRLMYKITYYLTVVTDL